MDTPSNRSLEEARKIEYLLDIFDGKKAKESRILAIAEALNRKEAEVREECAKIAETRFATVDEDGDMQPDPYAIDIATAIRAGIRGRNV